MGNNLDISVLDRVLDDYGVAEVADAAIDLDALLEELGEGGDVEDLVAGGLGSVDDELYSAPISPIPFSLKPPNNPPHFPPSLLAKHCQQKGRDQE